MISITFHDAPRQSTLASAMLILWPFLWRWLVGILVRWLVGGVEAAFVVLRLISAWFDGVFVDLRSSGLDIHIRQLVCLSAGWRRLCVCRRELIWADTSPHFWLNNNRRNTIMSTKWLPMIWEKRSSYIKHRISASLSISYNQCEHRILGVVMYLCMVR